MDLSAQVLEHLLPERVAVARGAGAVVRGAVAFDLQQVSSRLVWIEDGAIDEQSGGSDLLIDLVSLDAEPLGDGFLERRVGLSSRAFGDFQDSARRSRVMSSCVSLRIAALQ